MFDLVQASLTPHKKPRTREDFHDFYFCMDKRGCIKWSGGTLSPRVLAFLDSLLKPQLTLGIGLKGDKRGASLSHLMVWSIKNKIRAGMRLLLVHEKKKKKKKGAWGLVVGCLTALPLALLNIQRVGCLSLPLSLLVQELDMPSSSPSPLDSVQELDETKRRKIWSLIFLL